MTVGDSGGGHGSPDEGVGLGSFVGLDLVDPDLVVGLQRLVRVAVG